MKKLYIEEVKEIEEPKDINYERLSFIYDLNTNIGVQMIRIQKELEVGKIYEFTYEDCSDIDAYDYIVLKKVDDVYYIAEYYHGKFIRTKESLLADVWIKCNIKEKYGVDIEQILEMYEK